METGSAAGDAAGRALDDGDAAASPDIVVNMADGSLVIFLNDGKGQFTPAPVISLNGVADTIDIADLDSPVLAAYARGDIEVDMRTVGEHQGRPIIRLRRDGADRDGEIGPGHRQAGQLGGDSLAQRTGCLGARPAEIRGGRGELGPQLVDQPLQGTQRILGHVQLREAFPGLRGPGQHTVDVGRIFPRQRAQFGLPGQFVFECRCVAGQFGQVGAHLARHIADHRECLAELFAQAGAKIVAAQDHTGAICNAHGLDMAALLPWLKQHGGVAGFPGGERLGNEEFWDTDCEIMIPAALEGQITAARAQRLKARLVLEGANGPTVPEADDILASRGVLVVPDVI